MHHLELFQTLTSRIRIAATIWLVLAGLAPLHAQLLYEPVFRPKTEWMELRSPHFRVLYPAGHDSTARAAAAILEERYATVENLFRAAPRNLPVVVDPWSEAGYGYVSPLQFRIEIGTAPIKGTYLNPRSGTWLETVLPHELVHAAQMEATLPVSPGGLLRLASPDLARALHTTLPLGVVEGIAVVEESWIDNLGSGRIHHGHHARQFKRDGELGESLNPPGANYPYDRHYIGGGYFMQYLMETYGEEAVRDPIRLQASFVLPSYGVWLKVKTGKWPGEHREALESWAEDRGIGHTMPDRPVFRASGVVPLAEGGALAWGDPLNGPVGLYRTDADGSDWRLVAETGITEDAQAHPTTDGRYLLFSDYAPHAVYDGQFHHVERRLDMATGAITSESGNRFAVLPVLDGEHWFERWGDRVVWRFELGGEPVKTVDVAGGSFQLVRPNPVHAMVTAVVVRKGTRQALWLAYPKYEAAVVHQQPDIALPGGAITHAEWSADGRLLYLGVDEQRRVNTYRYDYVEDRLYRLDVGDEGLMHPVPDVDGRYLWFETLNSAPVRVPAEGLAAEEIPKERWAQTRYEDRPALGAGQPVRDWPVAPYRPGGTWLKPRTVLPGAVEEAVGASFHSGDPLRRWGYGAFLGVAAGKPWFDAELAYAGRHPGLVGRAYALPLAVAAGDLLAREAGAELGLRFQRRYDSPARFSGWALQPAAGYNRLHVGTTSGAGMRLSTDAWGYYRLRQRPRSPQPDAGWMAVAQVDHDLWTESTRSALTAFRSAVYGHRGPVRAHLELITQNRVGYVLGEQLGTGFDSAVLLSGNTGVAGGLRVVRPVWHPDRGSITVPVYMERLYWAATVHHVRDRDGNGRTALAAGLRLGGRLGNLGLDVGIGLAWEPLRKDIWGTGDF